MHACIRIHDVLVKKRLETAPQLAFRDGHNVRRGPSKRRLPGTGRDLSQCNTPLRDGPGALGSVHGPLPGIAAGNSGGVKRCASACAFAPTSPHLAGVTAWPLARSNTPWPAIRSGAMSSATTMTGKRIVVARRTHPAGARSQLKKPLRVNRPMPGSACNFAGAGRRLLWKTVPGYTINRFQRAGTASTCSNQALLAAG